MTKARIPAGAGSEYIVDATQIPTNITWDTVSSVTNNLRDGIELLKVRDAADASADFVWKFNAEDNGQIVALRYDNGAVAMDSAVGWELNFLNLDNANESLGYFGLGSSTEAAKATDVVTAVAASASTEIACSATTGFNKGDTVQVTADRDGTTGVGNIELVISYESTGR